MLERWRRRGGGDVDRAWATLLADRNNALGLEAAEAREAAAGAAWEREAAREEGTARLVEVAELDLRDATRQGGEAREAAPLARSRAEAEEARAEVAGTAAAELAAPERRWAEGAKAHTSALAPWVDWCWSYLGWMIPSMR